MLVTVVVCSTVFAVQVVSNIADVGACDLSGTVEFCAGSSGVGNTGEGGGEPENGSSIESGTVTEGEASDVDDNEDEDKDGGLFRTLFS